MTLLKLGLKVFEYIAILKIFLFRNYEDVLSFNHRFINSLAAVSLFVVQCFGQRTRVAATHRPVMEKVITKVSWVIGRDVLI